MAIDKNGLLAAIRKWKSFTSNDRSYGMEECMEKALQAYESAKSRGMTDEEIAATPLGRRMLLGGNV